MKKRITPLFAISLFTCLLFSGLPSTAGGIHLYVATNKENYSLAEKVRFQVFLLNPTPGTNHTAFVELLDCQGNRLVKKMLPFSYNISWGDVDLPENLSGQFCILYCYVADKDSIQSSVSKKIFIAGKAEKTEKKWLVNSFYEGDSFVAESPNNILIRCTDEKADPISVKGKIVDDKNQVYALFETNKQGYAKTRINPENRVAYYISITDNSGAENRTRLRMAMPAGITLNTEMTADSITYTLVSYSATGAVLPEYKIEALVNGEPVYDAAINFQNGLSAISERLKRSDFTPGFIVFRVTDKSGRIYTQRVLYNADKRAQTSSIRIIDTVNKKEATIELPAYINGRAYINMALGDLNARDNSDPVFLENTDNNISFNDQLIAAADSPGSFYSPDERSNHYLSLSGTLVDAENKPVKNKLVTLVLVHKNLKKEFLSAKTDKEGHLKIDNLVFYDSATVYYQLADKSSEKNDVHLDLKVTPSPGFADNTLPVVLLVCANETALAANAGSNASIGRRDEKTLQQVVVSAEKEKTETEKFVAKYVSGQLDRQQGATNEYDFIKNPPVVDNISLVEFIKGRFAGIKVLVSATTGTPELTGTFGGTVGVYLNDLELREAAYGAIANLTIKDVALVRYYSMGFKPRMIQGDILRDIKAANAGDLMIYTRKDFVADEKTKGLPKTTVTGYDLEKPVPVSGAADNSLQSVFWQAGWEVGASQTIYVNLPAGRPATNATLVIEGINNLMAPYRFTQKLVFN